MKINSMNTFEELPNFELVDELAQGDFDMNIQDVVIKIEDIDTGKQYIAEDAYFEHGIDEYFINENTLA
jgi:hypothetical protein